MGLRAARTREMRATRSWWCVDGKASRDASGDASGDAPRVRTSRDLRLRPFLQQAYRFHVVGLLAERAVRRAKELGGELQQG